MSKKIFNAVTLFVLMLAAYFLYMLLSNYFGVKIIISRHTVMLAVVFIVVVLGLHFIKMSRLFFIMLEQKIRLRLFAHIYAKTAFVNLMIPYKLGEAYRFYCLADVTKKPLIGLLSVVIDRFFDTFALLAMLVPLELFYLQSLSSISILLVVFLVICVAVYTAFPSIYNYLNKFLILSTTSRRSIKALAVLEELRKWYQYSQALLKGRVIIITLLSAIAWAVESCALYLLAKVLGLTFVLEDFIYYIHSIFSLNYNELTYFYFAISALVLAVIALIFFIVLHLKKEDKQSV